ILFFFSMLMCFGCAERKKAEETGVTIVEPDDRPNFEIRTLKGDRIQVKSLSENMMLIFFQPDCDHCHNEAKQIKDRLALFKDYKLYFISSQSAPEITKFAEQYQLLGNGNVEFATATVQDVLDHYGPIETPSIYVYSKKGKLIQSFNGEVEIDVVLKYI
ncbi:MAG: peroxiredoxin family protein, partial [Bacteroidota bacterium]